MTSLRCYVEYEAWGPHEGCKEFMDAPDTWACDQPVVALVIATDRQTQRDWDRYGPWTQEDIDRSDGHLNWPTYTILSCAEHLPDAIEDDPFTMDMYVQLFREES